MNTTRTFPDPSVDAMSWSSIENALKSALHLSQHSPDLARAHVFAITSIRVVTSGLLKGNPVVCYFATLRDPKTITHYHALDLWAGRRPDDSIKRLDLVATVSAEIAP